MTRLISVLIILLLLMGGWGMFKYWQQFEKQNANAQEQKVARITTADQLPGLPAEWEPSLQAAEEQGPEALGKWLKAYGAYVQDPRKAWIELDYSVMISRDAPNEAKRIFEKVKERVPPTSPVWPRIHELEKSYE